jgi:hypothetical protein
MIAYFAALAQGHSTDKKAEKIAEFIRNASIQLASMLFSLSSGLAIFDAQLVRQHESAYASELAQTDNLLLKRVYLISRVLFGINNSDFVMIFARRNICDPRAGTEQRSAQSCAYDYIETLGKNYKPPISLQDISQIRQSLRASDDIINSSIVASKVDYERTLLVESKLNHFLDAIQKDLSTWPEDLRNSEDFLPYTLDLMKDYRKFHIQLALYAYRVCAFRNIASDPSKDYDKIFDDINNVTKELNFNPTIMDIVRDDVIELKKETSKYQEFGLVGCDSILAKWGFLG